MVKVNVFNRIIMVIAMLCLIVFSLVAMVNVFAGLFEWSAISDRVINYATNLNPYILAGILFLILVVALIILILEFYRRKIKLANIYTDSSGKTMVTIKTSANQIKESINDIQGVINPQVKVVPRQNGIIIDIFSKLITGVNVADKTKEIREAASDFASKKLGFKVLQTNYTANGFVNEDIKAKAAEEARVAEEAKAAEEAKVAEEAKAAEEAKVSRRGQGSRRS